MTANRPAFSSRATSARTPSSFIRNPTLRPMVVEHLRAYAEKPEVPFRILNLLSDRLATMNKFDETLEVLKQMVDRSVDPVATIRESSHKILRRSPHHLPTLKFLGDIYKEHGRFTDMIHSYSLYLSNGGEETEDMVRSLCEAYIALGDYQNAKKFSKRLLEIEPDKIEFLRDLVVLANRSDAPEDAAEYLKKLEMANPRDRKVQALKLETEHALGERRFNFLKQEQETGEGGGETLEKLGDLAMEMEKIQDAITYFQRASRDKENPILARRCMAKLALAYMKKRLDQLAAETLRSIKISQTDDDPNEVAIIMDIYYQIGLIFEEFKFYEKAEQVFTQILRIDAGYRDVLDRVEGLRR